MFGTNMSPPSSGLKSKASNAGFLLGLLLNPKTVDDIYYNFHWTTWHYIPDDKTLHNHQCKNPKHYHEESALVI
jgi:hypothetical protein